MRDEGASGIPPWRVQVGHAVRIARDCEWHGDPESVADLKRVEVVSLASENLLFRPARGGKVPKNQVLDRLRKFANGKWVDLLGREASESASSLRSRRSRTRVDTVEKRVERAEALISMGEISVACHALEGSPVAPGNEDTLNALRARIDAFPCHAIRYLGKI